MIQIKNLYTGEVIYTHEDNSLTFANLRGANLHGANLHGANLCDADLHGADLRGADLRGADLRDANLHGANLHGADLCGANLCDADLRGANLRGADLCDAKNPPLVIYGLRWVIWINGFGDMQIGCQNHAVESWRTFSEEDIDSMSTGATEFWVQHKTMLLALCDSHKHLAE